MHELTITAALTVVEVYIKALARIQLGHTDGCCRASTCMKGINNFLFIIKLIHVCIVCGRVFKRLI